MKILHFIFNRWGPASGACRTHFGPDGFNIGLKHPAIACESKNDSNFSA